jgi:hypothetical protein
MAAIRDTKRRIDLKSYIAEDINPVIQATGNGLVTETTPFIRYQINLATPFVGSEKSSPIGL